MNRPRAPGRKRKWLIRFLAVLGALALVWLILTAHARVKLAREMAAARRSGDPLTFAEIAARRPPIPDAENGALVLKPLLEEIEALSVSRDSRLRTVPLLGKRLPPPGQTPDAEGIATARVFLQERADLLHALDRMSAYPRGRFESEVAPDPLSTALPHLTQLRGAVRLKVLDALIKAVDRRADDAARDIRIMLNIAATVEDEGLLVSTLIYAACVSMAAESLERTFTLGACSEQVLRELGELLRRHEDSQALLWGLWGERALHREELQGKSAPVTGWPAAVPALRWLGATLRALDLARTLSCMGLWLELARNPDGQAERIHQLGREQDKMSAFYSARMLAPPIERAFVLWLRRTAELRCARVALAVERYRLAEGGWPETLEALVPEYLEAVPPDPFDGRPLRYRATDPLRGGSVDRVVVYSVGENLVDDGGALDPTAKGERDPDDGFRLLHPRLRVPRFAQPPASAPAEEESDFP